MACARNSLGLPHVPARAEATSEPFFCAICGKDITSYTVKLRESHASRCVQRLEGVARPVSPPPLRRAGREEALHDESLYATKTAPALVAQSCVEPGGTMRCWCSMWAWHTRVRQS